MVLSRAAEWIWVIGACVLLHFSYASFQPVNNRNGGLAFDGQHYFTVAQQTPRRLPPRAEPPFVYRIATPMAAAALAKSMDWVLASGFDRINVVASGITVLLLSWWLQRHLASASMRVLVIVFFMIDPHSPMRFSYFYPINVDATTLMFLAAGLLGLDYLRDRRTPTRVIWMSLLVGIGVTVREVVLVIAFAALVVRPKFANRGGRWLVWLPLSCGIVSYALIRWWVHPEAIPSEYSEIRELWRWSREKSVVQVILASLLVFGPALLVPLLDWRRSLEVLTHRRDWALYCGAFVVLAIFGGSDTERILVFAAPIVYLSIGLAFCRIPLTIASPAMALLILGQIATARLFLPIGGPSPPPQVVGTEWNRIPTDIARFSTYDSLWTQFCGPETTRLYLIWFGLIAVAMTGYLSYRRRDAHSAGQAVAALGR